MARPRRATVEAWYDIFSDMPLEDQAAALRILEQVHRLAVRDSKRRMEPTPIQGNGSLMENGDSHDGGDLSE